MMKSRVLSLLIGLICPLLINAQIMPNEKVLTDSIQSDQGWIRKWDRVSLVSVKPGKSLENVFLKKGSRLTKVKLPAGEWETYLNEFVRNERGEDFMIVYVPSFRERFYIRVSSGVERFRIERKRRLADVVVDMERLKWADSVYVDGRRKFLRRWDSFLFVNQEGDDYSEGWLTMEVRSRMARETGLFERGIIGTDRIDFFRNNIDSTFWIGFRNGLGNRRYFYPIDSLSNFRINIKRNARPFWSNRLDGWQKIDQESLTFQGVEIKKEQSIVLRKCTGDQYKHIFNLADNYTESRTRLVKASEVNEKFVEGTFRSNRFYEVKLNGESVKVVEIIAKPKGMRRIVTPILGYLILRKGYREEVEFQD